METTFIIIIVIASFFLGFFVHERVCRVKNLDEKCRNIIKKHRDISNWLKSELVHTTKKKMGKRNIDQNKVKLLELIIKKLEK